MDSYAYRVRQCEIGVVKHEGREFSAGGSSVSGAHVTGYMGKHGQLNRWNGEQMLSGNRHVEFAELSWGEFSDTGQVCGWKLAGGHWIVGWSMGESMLFRGELVKAEDESDAARQARSIAEYWIDRDCEDQQADQEEQVAALTE